MIIFNDFNKNYIYKDYGNTVDDILNIYQTMAKIKDDYKNTSTTDIVTLHYNDWHCALDIGWDDIVIENEPSNECYKLVVRIFFIDNNEDIQGVSEELKLSDIYKKGYLEDKMKSFFIETIGNYESIYIDKININKEENINEGKGDKHMKIKLLTEEVNSILETLKAQDWVKEEGLVIRPLTEVELNILDVEISSSIYEMVLEFLRDNSNGYPAGTLLKVRRMEDDEEFYLLVAEDSEGEPMWLNLDFTHYSIYDSDFYNDHEVISISRPEKVFNKIGEITNEI